MKLQGVTPDHICYSTLIAGAGPCLRSWAPLTWGPLLCHARVLTDKQAACAALICPAAAGFEKHNQLERARRYHGEMLQAGLVPRTSAMARALLMTARHDIVV